MQKDYNESQLEDELLNNSLLFNTIRKNKSSEDKIKKIKKYIDRGANINATDANNKNNTPLHVAVLKEEMEVVKFLLERGACVTSKNSDNQTALDIARLLVSPKIKEIATILEIFNANKLSQSSSQQYIDATLTRKSPENSKELKKLETITISDTPSGIHAARSFVACDVENPGQSRIANPSLNINRQMKKSPKPQQCSKDLKSTKANKIFHYQKRSGTSGLSGQLYETKLLSLILFRALYVQNVNKFFIATNVDGMGAFDDIIFRYYSNKVEKQRIMFIQAKHRDNPAKDKITVDEILKQNGDFSLHKYLESYLKISQTFVPDNEDDMFRGEFKNMDCDFIIYTSAIENFTKMKVVEQTETECFMNTKSGGKIFQFAYNDQDVEFLVQTVAKSRAVLLAKRLSKFILKDNYSNMLMDDLMKTYHVFLARHVLTLEFKDNSQNNFCYAKFRESFFTSNDNLLLAFKATICKEVMLVKKNVSTEKLDEIENILKSLSFKVPFNFGNVNFCFSGSEQKKQRRLEYLCLKFQKLFENADISTNIVVKVDDNMVGPNEILQSTDVETYRLGGLVGNLLIFDDVTNTLKFNTDQDSLSEDNLKLYERLKHDALLGIDLCKCRLDINVHRFPRLSLIHNAYDKILIKEFLNKLKFYTNQATEDEVENILKKEIDKYFVSFIPSQSDALFRVKSDAIFLKVHDRIQKWWKHPNKAPYLTDSCEFFLQAKQDILNSPLLSILNFTYTETLKNNLTEFIFKDSALESLELDKFFSSVERILNVITEENALSSIKIIQYFKEKNDNNYTFINLDYIGIEKYFEDVKSEIKESKINTLIVVCNSVDVFSVIYLLIKCFSGKIIIISNCHLTHEFSDTPKENIVKKVDRKIGFKDLADAVRKMLLKERNVVFQGKEVPLGVLLEDESEHLINSNVLCKIINKEKIAIGNIFNNSSYDEILDYYINEEVCRYITLSTNVHDIEELNVLKFNELRDDFEPDTKDIVLITDKYEEFAEFNTTHTNCNVHWFSGDESLVWRNSRGNLQNMLKHIHRGSHDAYTFKPMTLKDFNDKVVIISAEPGMGKSSLLTHLAINTKHEYPALWISKINLLENINEFNRWKESKVNIDLTEAVKFLYRVIGFEACKGLQEKKYDLENIVDQVYIMDNNIGFNNNKKLTLIGLNLLEIELFNYSFNNGRVALLFDGFDEICPDFANEFMHMVNSLKKSKVAHLWVTSRLYNVLHQLESALETFSFTIQPFRLNDQVEFLEKIWLKKLEPSKFEQPLFKVWGIQHMIKGFLSVLSAVLRDLENRFISIPLHLFMISEIFQDSFDSFPVVPESIDYFIRKQNTMDKINLNQIYERFVDVKFFKIRFGEKKPFLCMNDPDMRKLVEKERTAFFSIHKKIAAHVVFGKSGEIELFDKHDIKEIRDFVERIAVGEEKTGIIEQIIQNEPKFVHYTFAEYFATEFLCDRLKSFPCETVLWKYLLNTILQSDEGGVRRFLNAKLGNDPHIFNVICNTGNLNIIFKQFISQQQKLAKMLFIAIDEYLENIALFLLKCVNICANTLSEYYVHDFINVVSKGYNKSCIVCIAVERSAKRAVSLIIELIKGKDIENNLLDLFYCCDLPNFNPMLLAYGAVKGLVPNLEMLDILWSDVVWSNVPTYATIEIFLIQYNNMRYNIKSTKLIHIVASVLGNRHFKCFDKALKRLNQTQLMSIFSAKDSDKKLAAHIAAANQSYEFFDKLDSLLDINQFKKICLTVDMLGLTPIQYFEYEENRSDQLKVILNKVYGSETNAKLTLDYFIGKKQSKPKKKNHLARLK